MPGKGLLPIEEFLKDAREFQLGDLPTEARHPRTGDLSHLARNDLPAAIAALSEVDRNAILSLERRLEELEELSAEIGRTLKEGRRVFLCGCGATGRMALALESLWRKAAKGPKLQKSVVSFMAGGDIALIRSIENFEDRPEFGARMLDEAGFRKNDLLIACTEGGETPFVIGAVERAARIALRRPYFVYCNPDSVLRAKVARSRAVLENPSVRCLSLFVGPMALAGSTRMQATTVLMLAVGHALLARGSGPKLRARIGEANRRLAGLDLGFIKPFVEKEHEIYEKGHLVTYESARYALTVLTDTTERAPTFSVRAFENSLDADPRPSLSTLTVPRTASGAAAWKAILGRAPRPLEWPAFRSFAGSARLRGFDLSPRGQLFRQTLAPGSERHHRFGIERKGQFLELDLDGLKHRIPIKQLGELNEQVLVKLLLNAHSLLVMGRLGRYEGNLMTWVKPSNRKLVDRAIRYARYLLGAKGKGASYEEVARVLLEEMAALDPEESIVLRTVARMTGSSRP